MQIKSLGKVIVAAAGTPVPIYNQNDPGYKVTKIRLVPLSSNTGNIYVGLKSFNKTTGVGLIDHLDPDPTSGAGDRFLLDSHDTNTLYPATLWIDADVSGDGVVASVAEA